MQFNFQYVGVVCILISVTLLFHPAIKIKDNQLILKGYIHKSIIELDNILKVKICPLAKGELIEVVTKDYDYYFFPIKGGRLKDLISDFQELGIDASYTYGNGATE